MKLAPEVRWFDDWFAIQEIAPGLTAIAEPNYHQLNWHYLIAGTERALLFDTGPGLRDLKPVVDSLTALPLTVMPSHLHYDHTGNLHRFADIAMPDRPEVRRLERDGLLQDPGDMHLGWEEDLAWRPVAIARWWPPGHVVDLGGIRLELLHTPGHTRESVSLQDAGRSILLASDFVYPGELFAQFAHASLPDYLATAERLAGSLPADTRIFCAHGKPDEQGLYRAPELATGDIRDLARVLAAIKTGGLAPQGRDPLALAYQINPRLTLLTAPASFGTWQAPI